MKHKQTIIFQGLMFLNDNKKCSNCRKSWSLHSAPTVFFSACYNGFPSRWHIHTHPPTHTIISTHARVHKAAVYNCYSQWLEIYPRREAWERNDRSFVKRKKFCWLTRVFWKQRHKQDMENLGNMAMWMEKTQLRKW